MMNSTMPAPYNTSSVWTLVNGSAKGDATQLDPDMLAPFDGNRPPYKRANITKAFQINQTGIVEWVVDKYSYSEAKVPIIFGNGSDGWVKGSTLPMPFNSTIDIIMTIANDSMDVVIILSHPFRYKLTSSGTDGPPNASSWSQVLGPRLWRWKFPTRLCRRRTGNSYQYSRPAISRHDRIASLRLGCYSVSAAALISQV